MSEQEPQDASEGIVGQSGSTGGLEPLPCPFCGGTDIIVMDGSTFRWVVATCGCGAACGEVRVQTTGMPREVALAEAKQRAIVEWNTRSNAEITRR